MPDEIDLNPCGICGEAGIVVSLDSGCFVRPRRRSACRGYRFEPQVMCRTAVLGSSAEAVAAWNRGDLERKA
jgi:hypothetical protein